MIRVQSLTATTLDGQELLSDINLNLAQGQTLGVYGPNGSGKSTLLRAISGVSRARNLLGLVQVAENSVDSFTAIERAHKIIYLGSDFNSPFELKVRELFELGAQVLNRPQGNISEVVEYLSIQNFLNRDFNSLSDGEKQLMMFARALIQRPEVIVFDESFSKLDLDKLILVAKAVRHYSALGLTTIIASHDLNFLSESADEFLFLKSGKKIASGNVTQVLNETNLELLYPGLSLHVVVSPDTGRFKILY
jgi:iron complex transport system ATP-binding protein